jgi:AraC-like DNA-binding protein
MRAGGRPLPATPQPPEPHERGEREALQPAWRERRLHLAQIGRAIALIHREPAMSYVARWRMHVAVDALEEQSATVGELAARLGYRSETAFARAFKRVIGKPPGAVRRATALARAARA